MNIVHHLWNQRRKSTVLGFVVLVFSPALSQAQPIHTPIPKIGLGKRFRTGCRSHPACGTARS
jgi:hypothetical protein